MAAGGCPDRKRYFCWHCPMSGCHLGSAFVRVISGLSGLYMCLTSCRKGHSRETLAFLPAGNGCTNGCGVAVALLALGRQLVGCIGCEIFCTLSDVTVERYLSASGVFSDFSCCSQTLWGIQSTGGISETFCKTASHLLLATGPKIPKSLLLLHTTA